ncbi:sensor histidine kinase [Sunxiuqinia elliptica]|uniref:histidine kinase n=1 Tax=Sunxiuqinia elliptica TaxID=655355 RepID=A0A4V3BX31_9BACT|nr:HAMP domain-containing sensor histidine kinase [Sunxiuqinia elliptica]TDN97098.1 phospho-acceptor domain-containing protein [Sunxiuqinia elliptica]TDO60717.1 phospho-acceptor domain-containing protein [Sunxiuqinia elliptica]
MAKLKLPKRLMVTTILMALILVLIIGIIVSLINEKGRIQSALNLSQQNREQLLKSESVTESLLLVEARFQEYCITFERPVFEDYKFHVQTLAENILQLQQTVAKDTAQESDRISGILDEKTRETDIYVRLKQTTDSLIFSVEDLEEYQADLEKYTSRQTAGRVDTISVTETRETRKKGLFGKIRSAIVGEKVQENVSTKLRVQSPNSQEITTQSTRSSNSGSQPGNMKELVQKTYKLKESELKLIAINNSLIAEIHQLIDEIKNNIRAQEAKQNNSFLVSVRSSTDFLQNILIALMLLACILAGYILLLAFKNDRFQEHIVNLNQKVTKDSLQKDKFFSIVSHDLMNPFNALLGFSEMLNESAKKGNKEDTSEYASIVHQSAKRIFNLLQNLLVWTRMQNGKTKYAPKTEKVEELVSDTMLIVAPIAQNKQIKLEWDVEKEITAKLDSNMIGSALQNLVTNAIKFTENGGSVKVTATTESDNLNFVVADTGVGMSSEQVENLFKLDKNSSSRGTNDEVGTGLGLIIAKEFIDFHQGKIWAESNLGKGSKFCFSIPLS